MVIFSPPLPTLFPSPHIYHPTPLTASLSLVIKSDPMKTSGNSRIGKPGLAQNSILTQIEIG